jgi:hypothetical protein
MVIIMMSSLLSGIVSHLLVVVPWMIHDGPHYAVIQARWREKHLFLYGQQDVRGYSDESHERTGLVMRL